MRSATPAQVARPRTARRKDPGACSTRPGAWPFLSRRNDMPQRTCGTSGCPNAHRAKGLCSSCYNRQHQPDRHRKATVSCGWCGKPTLKHVARRYGARFCTLTCRDEQRAEVARQRKLPVLFVGQAIKAPRPVRTPPPTPAPRRWTAGRCAECSAWYLDAQPRIRYCSRTCSKRAHRRAWKERTGRLVPAAIRALVYERDRWTCWLCRKPILRDVQAPHPLSHSVDHVVPQSEGGEHTASNLRTAHFMCNSVRGNRGGNEQLALL